MADGATTNFGFILPEDGLSRNTWGIKLNQNWIAVDTLIAALFPVGKIEVYTDAATDPNTFLPGTWERFAEGRALVGVGTSNADENGETRIVTDGEEFGNFNQTLTAAQVPAHNHGPGSLGGSTDFDATDHTHPMPHTHGAGTLAASGGEHSHDAIVSTGPEIGPPSSTMQGLTTYPENGQPTVENNRDMTEGTHTHTISGSTGGSSTADTGLGSASHDHSVTINSGTTGDAGGGEAHNNIQPSIGVHYWRRTA